MFQGLRQVLADLHGVIIVVPLEDQLAAFETYDFAMHQGLALAIPDPECVEAGFGAQTGGAAVVAIVKERFARPLGVRRDVGEMDKTGDLPQVGPVGGRSEENVPLS